MNTLIRYFAKKYVRGILNDALDSAKNRCDVEKYRNRITSIIGFLSSLMTKLEDNAISEEEMEEIIEESQKLF